MLSAKVMDPDEKVRAAACKLYSQLDYEAALHHVSEAQLRAVAGRGKDKKVSSLHYCCLLSPFPSTASCAQ
jgi:sister-chromatid-cohesion protein PDS5